MTRLESWLNGVKNYIDYGFNALPEPVMVAILLPLLAPITLMVASGIIMRLGVRLGRIDSRVEDAAQGFWDKVLGWSMGIMMVCMFAVFPFIAYLQETV